MHRAERRKSDAKKAKDGSRRGGFPDAREAKETKDENGRGGVADGVTKRAGGVSALVEAAESGSLGRRLRRYLRLCRDAEEGDAKKSVGRLPTLAGFCAMLGCGIAAAEELRRLHPSQFDYLAAILEDEALNSGRSPAIVNSYLKERLGYGERIESSYESESEEMRLIFAHDILEDGA